MCVKLIFFFFLFITIHASAQNDSAWNVMLIKKGSQPEIGDTLAVFRETGFNLYRNCFYDLQLKDRSRKTLRLLDIKPDTLIFNDISKKTDAKPSLIPTDTIVMNYTAIDKILLIRDWSSGSSKKINCNDYYFVFYKSDTANRLESKYDYVFPSHDAKNELIPRLTFYGITYHYEYGGKLYYHSGIPMKTSRYTDAQKTRLFNTISAALNLLVNKRVDIMIKNEKQ